MSTGTRVLFVVLISFALVLPYHAIAGKRKSSDQHLEELIQAAENLGSIADEIKSHMDLIYKKGNLLTTEFNKAPSKWYARWEDRGKNLILSNIDYKQDEQTRTINGLNLHGEIKNELGTSYEIFLDSIIADRLKLIKYQVKESYEQQGIGQAGIDEYFKTYDKVSAILEEKVFNRFDCRWGSG